MDNTKKRKSEKNNTTIKRKDHFYLLMLKRPTETVPDGTIVFNHLGVYGDGA